MGPEYFRETTIHSTTSGPGKVTNRSVRGILGGVMGPDKVFGERTSPYDFAGFPSSRAQREEILEHLEQILSHPLFRNSKRYAAVLRYIVECTLQGSGAELKERTIGIEVFHRPPDYDTANDHVVRSAMSEVRRRLAQYYRDATSESEVRIDLQPGSYVPRFCRVVNDGPGASVAPLAIPLSEVVPIRPPQLLTRVWRRGVLLGVLAVLAAVTLLSRAYWSDPLQTFWSPVFSAQGPVLLCVGTLGQGRQSAGGIAAPKSPVTLSDFHSSTDQLIHINDAVTVTALARLLGQHKKAVRLASQSEANFADLQNGPAVLVGLMNNDWTERLISNLRYTVAQDSGRQVMLIRDRDNPAKHDWAINYSEPYLDVNKDYALILRVRDPRTDQVVVVAAGLSVFGTTAAGKFLTDPDDMKKLAAIAPRGWGNKNMEIVLSTVVIRGTAGHGTIVASQFW